MPAILQTAPFGRSGTPPGRVQSTEATVPSLEDAVAAGTHQAAHDDQDDPGEDAATDDRDDAPDHQDDRDDPQDRCGAAGELRQNGEIHVSSFAWGATGCIDGKAPHPTVPGRCRSGRP